MLGLAQLSVVLFAAHLSYAQTASTVPSSTSSTPAATHSVNVGAVSFELNSIHEYSSGNNWQAGLVFTPDSLTANVGDTVGEKHRKRTLKISADESEFRFYPQNQYVLEKPYPFHRFGIRPLSETCHVLFSEHI